MRKFECYNIAVTGFEQLENRLVTIDDCDTEENITPILMFKLKSLIPDLISFNFIEIGFMEVAPMCFK